MQLLKRWWIYISEVYPPGLRLAMSLMFYAGVTFLYQGLVSRSPLVVNRDLLPCTATVFLMYFYFRLQDEFKDRDTDRMFFPHRPVPSGRVSLADLRILMAVNFAALLVLNLLWGRAVGMLLVFLGYGMLMHNWFFMEKLISENRLLALATHGPFGFIANLFIVAVYVNRYEAPIELPAAILASLWFGMTCFYWDLARKTRAPREEMPGYQTYSAMIGYKGSSALTLAFILVQGLLLAFFPVSRLYTAAFWLCAAGLAAVFIRFLRKPDRGSGQLQPAAELFTAAVNLGIIADLIISRGLAWMS
jgi:4-hydroxybenzoate polyprenyltransferase